ncbi:MAG TPA: tetratricopeptide repeat protein [Pyrinomonadaceae bacterium]|nr:tetratricopeptide repeat protein [Pyrinomonadaceae bacterium]
MNRRYIRSILILATCAVLTAPLYAQPNRGEALLADAKALAAAADTNEKFEAAFAKFAEATASFRAAGNKAQVDESELEHGRSLRAAGVKELNAKHFAEAKVYLDRALAKVALVRNNLEVAFVYHDIGFSADQQGKYDEASDSYMRAIESYLAAGDKNGEAVILRNLGILHRTKKNYAEAVRFFQSALRIRQAMSDEPSQATLHLDLGITQQTNEKKSEALAEYVEAVKLYRKLKDRIWEARSLFNLGSLQYAMSKHGDAITTLTASLEIYQTENDAAAEAAVLSEIGNVLMSSGKYSEAVRYLDQAADLSMILKDPNSEGSAALDLSIVYQWLTQNDAAKSAIDRALACFRAAKNRTGEAFTLLVWADLQNYLNQHDEAFANINEARKILQEQKEPSAQYRIARTLSTHYHSLSNQGEAIRYALEALAIAEREKNIDAIAGVYVDLGNSYSALGQREKSIEYTTKAITLARQLGDVYMESISLSNLGYEYLLMERLSESEAHFRKAIALMKANGYERVEGYATHNLGLLYYKRKQYQLALANYDRAFVIYRRAGDRRPEAFLYDSYGELYRDLGQYDKALENLQKAIVLSREIKYSEVEANALGNMMKLWTRRGQPRLAVLYGKQAVNVYQAIRAGTRTLDKAAQKSFVQSNEKTYRQLANVLIDQGRLAEAQQVLDLLKAEEYFEFVRRDSAEASENAALALSETERNALAEYSRVSDTLTALGASYQKLQDERNKNGGKLEAAKEAEYIRLKTQVEAAGEGLKTFFVKLATEFSKKVEDGTVVTPQSIETLKADLRRVGPDVVLVSTYLLPERYRAIVTTGRTMVDRKVEYSAIKLTGADINRKIFEFQRALQNPKVDTRKLGKELYDIFVKPLENDLRGAGAKTILWSLDGSLRYIPLAALSPDGKTYLAEQYQNVVVTLGRQTNLFAKPTGEEWRAIGAGVSKQHAGFSALPSVPAEIGSIVRDQKHSAGVLDGTRMLDEQFNLESLRNTVPQQTEDGKAFNVLHLATHFSLGANDQDSALLLGDGTRLSLFEIGRDEALDFKDVELLTLSACQTGVSTGDANGREVESLGMLAQKKGAKAVLATLWKVADESTSLFMTEFYRIKKANPTMNKAEAIRLAQKEMIDGKIKSSGTSNGCRAETFAGGLKQNEFKCDPNAPFSHPYFWSPFVLIGNWR